MTINYHPLLGCQQGAQRLHIHLTDIPDTGAHVSYEHEHKAEEAVYILEGRAEYTFGGATQLAGPGDLVFFPSGVTHAKVTYLSPSLKYLVIRDVREEDAPCCCESGGG